MTKALTADIQSQEQQHHDGLQSQPEFGFVRGLDDSHSTTVHLRFLDAARQAHHGRILAVLQQSYASTTGYETRNRGVYSRFPCRRFGRVTMLLLFLRSAMGTSSIERYDTYNYTIVSTAFSSAREQRCTTILLLPVR